MHVLGASVLQSLRYFAEKNDLRTALGAYC